MCRIPMRVYSTMIAGILLLNVFAEAQEPRIRWAPNTLRLVQRGGNYARMIRLRTGEILCTYELGPNVGVKRSNDGGVTWHGAAQTSRYRHGNAANPELIELENGWVLSMYNERPTNKSQPFAIALCGSRNGGRTWSTPKRIYEADTKFENGCWEPTALQLPSGEVQLFFANENPYRTSGEQEITLLRSKDNGQHWSAPQRISFRSGHRDGMPVPLFLARHNSIVVAIEDNGLSGNFKPVIVSTSLEDNWKSGFVAGNSGKRWSALETPLPPHVYAGAPYIRQFPSGETVLSVQTSRGPKQKWQMAVFLGDDRARKFVAQPKPFTLPASVECLWNSLFIKDRTTVTAIAATTVNGIHGVWTIDGRLIRSR